MRHIPFAKSFSAALAVAVLAGGLSAANATTTVSTPLIVTATVLSTCVVVPAPIIFADYSLLAQGGISANIAVTCTPDVGSYQVALDAGTGSGATVAGMRKMTSLLNPSATLQYNLYRDAARTQPWGFTRNTDTVNSTGTLLQNYTVYAKLPANQYAEAGQYTDTVTVSLLY